MIDHSPPYQKLIYPAWHIDILTYFIWYVNYVNASQLAKSHIWSQSTLPVKHIIWQIVLICSNFRPTNFDTFACIVLAGKFLQLTPNSTVSSVLIFLSWISPRPTTTMKSSHLELRQCWPLVILNPPMLMETFNVKKFSLAPIEYQQKNCNQLYYFQQNTYYMEILTRQKFLSLF